MHSITFDSDQDALIYTYEADDYRYLDLMCAGLGVSWDNSNHLIKHSLEKLPSSLKSLRDNMPRVKNLEYRLKKIFFFTQNDLIESLSTPEYTFVFKFASITTIGNDEYYLIPGRILGIPQDVYLTTEVPVNHDVFKLFAAGYEYNTSIFGKISDILDENIQKIFIGGEQEDSIPLETFYELITHFPSTTLLKHYGDLQISEVICNYLTTKKDYPEIYANSRERIIGKSRIKDSQTKKNKLTPVIGSQSINYFRYESLFEAKEVIEEALKYSQEFDESFWQEKILSILPAIFPQYIAILRETVVFEKISDQSKKTRRRIDHLLIDASGNIDLLEIKRPFTKEKLLCRRKYRDNFIPAHELTGGIAQIEKYIYYLNHLGLNGEEEFSESCKKRFNEEGFPLPNDFRLKILNPHGRLLIGHCCFTEEEQRDFDLIRRQYSHVVDILTYDDLLERVKRILLTLNTNDLQNEPPSTSKEKNTPLQ